MDAALRKKIDELGGAVEEFKSFQGRVEKLEKANGGLPSDFKEQSERIDQALTNASKAKESLDTMLKDREQEQKRLSDLEAANDSFKSELEELIKKGNRPGAGGTSNPDVEAHKAAYNTFLRKGTESGLGELQVKALNTVADADGGFAVPEEVDLNIIELERYANPMRSVCGQITVSTPDYKKLVNLGGTAAGWVGETDERTETAASKLAQLPAFMGEVYANPASTQTALDDMQINVEAWLAGEVSTVFAEQENEAFTTGNGTNKAKGFLAYPSEATTDKDGTRAFGTFEERATAAINGDIMIDVIQSLRPGYRANARWMFSNLTVAEVRKLKDSDNQFLWRAGLEEGQPDRLLGYGITENEEMPEFSAAAGSKFAAFGNFARGYLVVDRIGTRVLRDPFTNKPYVHFYTTKRVGGMAVDTLAIKLLAKAA